MFFFFFSFNSTFGQNRVCHLHFFILQKTRIPCTLSGLDNNDYDLKEGICTPSFNGCHVDPRYPECIPNGVATTLLNEDYYRNPLFVALGEQGQGEDEEVDDDDLLSLRKKHAGFIEVCNAYNVEEIICQGVVSITYYACPSAGVVIGSSLGYITLVEMAAIAVVLSLYLLFRFIVTGKWYSYSDMMEETTTQANSKK